MQALLDKNIPNVNLSKQHLIRYTCHFLLQSFQVY